MSNAFFRLAPTTAVGARLSFNQATDSQTQPTLMCEEHTSPTAGAYHGTHVYMGCEERNRMYDFWLGVLTSLAVLIVTLAYRSHIGSNTRGMYELPDRLLPTPLCRCDMHAQVSKL